MLLVVTYEIIQFIFSKFYQVNKVSLNDLISTYTVVYYINRAFYTKIAFTWLSQTFIAAECKAVKDGESKRNSTHKKVGSMPSTQTNTG